MSRKPKFIFYHIPKCGGTSARLALYDIFIHKYNDAQIYLPQVHPNARGRKCGYLGRNFTTPQQYNQYVHGLGIDYKVYLCHITRCVKTRCMPASDPVTMTLIRDPVDRLISHYHHFNVEEKKQLPLNQFTKDMLHKLTLEYRDLMARYIISTPGNFSESQVYDEIDSIDHVYCLKDINMADLQRAIADQFDIKVDSNIYTNRHDNRRDSNNKALPIIQETLHEMMHDTIDYKLYNYVCDSRKTIEFQTNQSVEGQNQQNLNR